MPQILGSFNKSKLHPTFSYAHTLYKTTRNYMILLRSIDNIPENKLYNMVNNSKLFLLTQN
jgi:hypothetical protein